jgi:hypothetical protein
METTHYAVAADKIDQPLTIALIADLHCTKYGKNQHKLVEAVKNGNPDLILFAGDIFHHFGDREPGLTLIRQSAEIAPTYYVAGNHEKRNPEYLQLLDEVRENGGIVLNDEIAELEINGNHLLLAGVAYSPPVFNHNYAEFVGDFDGYKILLTHYPEDYVYYPMFDIMLAGHAHGGQVRIPWLVPNGLYSPGQRVFPNYTGGLYKIDEIDNNLTLVVSRGLSKKYSAMFRVFNKPELVFVTVE